MATVSYDFGEKVALITGSSSGIGRAAALKLGGSNARVVVVYHTNEHGAWTVVRDIENGGGHAIAVQADVADLASVKGMVQAAVNHFGQIDILVNNAGITRDALTVRMSEEDWSLVIATNLTGAFYCTKAVLRVMLRLGWGRIINVCSVVAGFGNIGQPNYAAAKAGLIALTKSVAKEVASRGILVNAVLPGCVDTPMWQGAPELARELLASRIYLGRNEENKVGRVGKPEEIANAIAFLASEEASYMTGSEVYVDGGLSIG